MAESRERVIEAAAELFQGGSFHKVGIAEICEVARVNKGTFYHFFPSKLDLLLEVLDRYVAECGADLRRVANCGENPERKVRQVFNIPRLRNQAWKDSHGVSSGCFVGNIILEMASSEPVVRHHVEKAIAELTLMLHPIVADYLLQHRDDFEESQVPAAAEVLMGLVQGAQVQAKATNDLSIFDKYAELAPAIILVARSRSDSSPN